MKRGREQEEDLSELLQLLDDEAAGPSNVGDNHWEPELEPKHKIFLSHSGVQKNFTEQLCVDLERWEYSPFFDKRPDSLPKGQKFPELIFQAAQQCRVAILVLSEDFFTRTKWPMLELEAFVQSQKDNPGKLAILPVYLGLSRNECTKNKTRRQHWLSVWRDWAKTEGRINVGKWEDALKVLGPSNGPEYMESLGEVALREQIVSAVRCLIPLESSWSGAHVQGRTHILKAIIKKLVSSKPSTVYGVRVVGIYGMGGIGKTTFCRVLCDELHMQFEGRVCHAELGSKSEPIELHKEVLRRLTNINHDSLMFKTEAMTMDLLRRRIHQQKVFLALDNVWQESLEQAKDYLRVGFHHGSIVMVTARSIDILNRLNIDKSDCLEMPDLEEEDAKQLFLQSATPHLQFMSEGDERKIQYCIWQCRFRKGANMEEHFHPLALKVLGAQLGSLGCDPSLWVENLSKDDKFNLFREKDHPIFNILRKGYDSLCEEDQLLFMDAILFHPSRRKDVFFKRNLKSGIRIKSHIFRVDIYKWLSIVHGLPEVRFIEDRLKNLKARSLIEDIGDGLNGVIVHDLYLDFAKSEVKRGALDARRWVWYYKEAAYLADLATRPSGNCWSSVKRISVNYVDYTYDKSIRWMGTVEGVKWQQFSNVVVLQLHIGRNEVLDLRGLQCLKSMVLRWGDLREGCKSGGQLIGLGELRNLAWLELRNLHFAPCFQEIGELTRLEVLRLDMNCSFQSQHSEPLEAPNLDKCVQLQELVLRCPCLLSFPDLSKLTSLRKILFSKFRNAKEVVGLSSQMTCLEELSLFDCASLSQCLGLSDLVSLQRLDVQICSQLRQTLDLHKLTKLRRLKIRWCGFKKLLGLNDSMQVQKLIVSNFDELPNLHLLKHLQRLKMGDIKPTVMPWFGSFIALEELVLTNLAEVRDIHGMRSLTRLKRLTISNAPDLLQLPELGDLMALQYLDLGSCCRLVGKLELPDLHNLINLEVLKITATPIRRLPSLERLTQLRVLDCSRTLLAELPVLNGFDKLDWIDLAQCHELTSLEKVGTLPALIGLNVSACYKLTRLPDLRSSRSLKYLSFCHTGVSLGSEDIKALAALPTLEMRGWNHVQVRFSELLEKMSWMEVELHLEAKQLEYFTSWHSRAWTDLGTCSYCSHIFIQIPEEFAQLLRGNRFLQ